jgi:UDP-glucose 4-epimerase
MRVVLTGSSGRVGRAIFNALAGAHTVVGTDRTPFSTTHIVGDLAKESLLRRALDGADAVIHAAAVHAPHVGMIPETEFFRINVEGTRHVAEAALAAGVKRLVFTSTTALYGDAVIAGRCSWIDEKTPPRPKTIYHRTKLEAEDILQAMAGTALSVRVLRMSRSFPEPADVMACYRLHRGVDLRDVADAHAAALTNGGKEFQRYIVSGQSPFAIEDCDALAVDAAPALRLRAPALAAEFARRGWRLPRAVDRIYDASAALRGLGWRPQFGFSDVLAQLDRRSLEVLPPASPVNRTSE